MKNFVPILFALLFTLNANAQLIINTDQSLTDLVNDFILNGVSVSNITFNGNDTVSLGTFTNGNTTNIGINNGILLSTGDVHDAVGPNNSSSISTSLGLPGDIDLDAIAGCTTNDAAILEFDLIPTGNMLEYNYVFASEEYPEFVTSFNDVFAFFLTGPNPNGGTYNNQNIALIPGTTTPVSIYNINNGSTNTGPCVNCGYYIANDGGLTIQYDGFTVLLQVSVYVQPNQTYHLKIAIGDAGDSSYDSGVFLQSPSLKSSMVSVVEQINKDTKVSIYPNPIQPGSAISYTLYNNQDVNIEIYDMMGKKVSTLVNEAQTAGVYQFSLDEISNSGTYILKTSFGNNVKTQRFLFSK